MDIYSNYRERTRVLETLFISFTRGKRHEAKRGRIGELVKGKNLGAKLKPRIELRRLEVRGVDFNHNLLFLPLLISDYSNKCF